MEQSSQTLRTRRRPPSGLLSSSTPLPAQPFNYFRSSSEAQPPPLPLCICRTNITPGNGHIFCVWSIIINNNNGNLRFVGRGERGAQRGPDHGGGRVGGLRRL
jgi:hypothetical protein